MVDFLGFSGSSFGSTPSGFWVQTNGAAVTAGDIPKFLDSSGLVIVDSNINSNNVFLADGSKNLSGSIINAVDNTDDLGSSSKRFRNAYVAGNLSDGTNSTTIAAITSSIGPGPFLPLTGGTLSGTVNTQSLIPITDDLYDIGSSTKRQRTMYGYTLTGPTNTRSIDNIVSNASTGANGNLPSFVSDKVIGDSSIASSNVFLADGTVHMTNTASVQHVYPETNNTYDLGISSQIFRNIYGTTLQGSVNSHNINNLVDVTGSVVAGNVASFYDGLTVQDSGTVAANLVTDAGTATSGRIATYTGNKVIHDSGTLLSALLTSSTAASTYIPGPGTVVSGDLVTFNGTTGLIVQDSGVLSSNLVQAASSTGVNNNIATFTGSRAIHDSGILITSLLTTASAATIYIEGPGTVVSGDLMSFSGTSGLVVADTGIVATQVVKQVGGAVVANNAASFNGTGGVTIQDSGIGMNSGKITCTTINSTAPSCYTAFSGTGAGSLAFTSGTARGIPATYAAVNTGNGDWTLNTSTGGMTYNPATSRTFWIRWDFSMIPLSSSSIGAYFYVNQNASSTPADYIDIVFYTVTANYQPVSVTRLVVAAHNDAFQLWGQMNGGSSSLVFKEMKVTILPVN